MYVAVWVVVGVFLTLAVPLSFYRLRKGGPGPQTNWIPRALRPATNRFYERHGWQKPYDDDGSRDPDRTVV